MRKRRIVAKRPTRWTTDQWELGWELAMATIEGVPATVSEQPIFTDCLTVLAGAFADGNHLAFELGLNALIDFCADTVDEGDCERWWNERE